MTDARVWYQLCAAVVRPEIREAVFLKIINFSEQSAGINVPLCRSLAIQIFSLSPAAECGRESWQQRCRSILS